MLKQSFSITRRNREWLKAQVATGRYGSASEVIRDMIREREMRSQESPEQRQWLQEKLDRSVQSGISPTPPDDLLEQFKSRVKPKPEI